jgi:hypothetical protein
MLARKFRWNLVVFALCCSSWISATPVDINGDSKVGAEEVLDLVTSWKGPASVNGDGLWQSVNGNVYYNNGNVGIGTSTPHHSLRIYGGPQWTANGWQGAVELENAAAIGWRNNLNGRAFGIGQSNGGLYFFTTSSEPGGSEYGAQYRMFISDFGDVGIGTESPSTRLDVAASGSAIRANSYSGQAIQGIGTYANGLYGSSSYGYGVYGQSTNTAGMYAYSSAGGSAGVYAVSPYIGVQGITTSGSTDGGRQGVRGDNYGSSSGWAGYFYGNLGCSGTMFKGGGAFKIDHPLDPENKYLSHSFVESPDMMNVYNGNVVLDENGAAEVTMPDWFMPLNKDFRYQLTAVGGPGPNLYIAKEMEEGVFGIAGGSAGLKVSWQVTGVRQDAFANARRIQVEEDKPEGEKGYFLYPEYYGKSKEESIPARMGVKTK